MVRHIVGADNVSPQGMVINPRLIRHGVIRAGRVADLGGLIDPLTHLNLDFADHRADACAVAMRLEVGSLVQWEADGLRFVAVAPEAYEHLGPVPVHIRRLQWLQTLQQRRQGKVEKAQ